MIYGSDLGELAYVIVVAPLLSLIWALAILALAIRRRRIPFFSTLSMLPIFWIVTLALFLNSQQLRWTARWLINSRDFKHRVVAQPNLEGELKHIEWDGYGFMGNDTVVYLVFDPSDALSTSAENKLSGKFNGIPCAVARVKRLESRWYAVTFYTDTDWMHCS